MHALSKADYSGSIHPLFGTLRSNPQTRINCLWDVIGGVWEGQFLQSLCLVLIGLLGLLGLLPGSTCAWEDHSILQTMSNDRDKTKTYPARVAQCAYKPCTTTCRVPYASVLLDPNWKANVCAGSQILLISGPCKEELGSRYSLLAHFLIEMQACPQIFSKWMNLRKFTPSWIMRANMCPLWRRCECLVNWDTQACKVWGWLCAPRHLWNQCGRSV